MRPKQWTKNLLVFAPLLFSGFATDPEAWLRVISAFLILCLVSGAVYILNDISDFEADQLHDKKRVRPIAAGRVSKSEGFVFSAAVLLVSLLAAKLLGTDFLLVVVGYLTLQVLYTLHVKHLVILDVMVLAAGFVLRAYAGAVVIDVEPSPWLVSCVGLLALYLALGKRRSELVSLSEGASGHRVSLGDYSISLIDQMVSIVLAAALVAYSMYAFLSVSAEHKPWLMLTIPFVAYGLFRYLYLMHSQNKGGEPEEILLTDAPTIINLVLWLLVSAAIIYVT